MGGKRSQAGKESASSMRKMGLITTQMLNSDAGYVQPSKSVLSKQESSVRESKMSIYSDNNYQYETRTEDGRKTGAVLTDPKIHLFGHQSAHPTSQAKRHNN